MCGRFVMSQASSDLVPEFKVDELGGQELSPSWNVVISLLPRQVIVVPRS